MLLFSTRQRLGFTSSRNIFVSTLSSSRTYATAKMAPDFGQWKLNHTMLRIKDPKKSLAYYELLGLKQINKLSFPENKFDLYFLGE